MIEVGAGTGIATEPLARGGLTVTAIEPSPAMAALAEVKLRGRGSLFVGRFEDYLEPDPVQLIASLHAWHWATTFLAVTKTYGGQRSDAQYEAIGRTIDAECGGSVTKVEDAAVYVWRRQ